MGTSTSTSTPFTAWTGTSREGHSSRPASEKGRAGVWETPGAGNRATGPGHERCVLPPPRRTEGHGGEVDSSEAGPPPAPRRQRAASDHGVVVKQLAEQPDREEEGRTGRGNGEQTVRRGPNAGSIIDTRVTDGTRVAICLAASAPSTAAAIRRFGGRTSTVEKPRADRCPLPVVSAAAVVLRRGREVLISGGTDSGATTRLNTLESLPPPGPRDLHRGTRELRQHRARLPAVRRARTRPRRDGGRRASRDGGPPRGGRWP